MFNLSTNIGFINALIGSAILLWLVWMFFGRLIDNLLNRITMYRLVLYVLIAYWILAFILCVLGILRYSAAALVISTLTLLAASWIINKFCARLLKVHANIESDYITVLILALIISPPTAGLFSTLPILIWASVLSQSSKYIVNFRNKHIFNPAALAVVLTSYGLGLSASWWIGTASMLPLVIIGGLLIVYKIRRFDAILAFLAAFLLTTIGLSLGSGFTIGLLRQSLLDAPLVFFATIMFSEPLTMPPTRDGRLAYGALVGFLFAPQTHIGSLYFSPELALVVGNIFSYAISPKVRPVFKLKQKNIAGQGVYDFVFESASKFNFKPGQYMEWTLGHSNPDSRGNRRYFTLANSPTEPNTLLGVKFYDKPSSFKRALAAMNVGDSIVGGQLAGDFTLPENREKKLVFVAGGIGITPFRSMLKYLIDHNEKRDVTILFSNRAAAEIVYANILMEAQQKLGIQTVYTLTTPEGAPADWKGWRGYIDSNMVSKTVPDFKDRLFYISGSHVMVDGVRNTLVSMGIPRHHIVTDFFPGLA